MKPYENLSTESMPGEIWKDIPGWEGYYQISSLGRAKSLSRKVSARANKPRTIKEHIIKQPIVNGRKYLSFLASSPNTRERIYIHRAVASVFIDNPKKKPCVDHINTDTFDNRVSNLRWVTYHENSSNTLTKEHTSKAKSGDNCFFYGKVYGNRRIRCTFPDGTTKDYNSIKDAGRDGFCCRSIQLCLSKSRLKHHKGCSWDYLD